MEGTALNTFLLNMPTHIIFCIISFVVLLIRFIKYRKSYQLLFAVIIPATLLLRLESFMPFEYRKPFSNAIAVFELILFVFGLILMIIEAVKSSRKKKEKNIEKTEPSEEA